MKLELSKKWQDVLKNLPETGMGYQKVKVTLKSGDSEIGFVTNCSVLFFPPDSVIISKNTDKSLLGNNGIYIEKIEVIK